MALVIPRVVLLLNERSAEYFYETREKMFGKPLEQVEKDADVDDCWEKVKGPVLEVGNLLRQHGGPFFLGETASYADFILVSMQHCVKRANEDVYEKLMALDYALPQVYQASKQWLEKEN
ncbi:glutathione S-transferase [Pyrenophora tritici-repentis]|uniref:Glutathione s-transferase n=1 Tax=Pyrenophora tritici-repentis TaxID=45151 RepID=A0A2W1CWM5_9PLEO|nr:glutathione s-transferase [Pyrenophora tritici-repentis]KAF7453709.1 glutathione s-transferase [Pyrenophora tritici-repentis]KAG9387469.1 glutathione s-transferase [Pyrenophora tritici-repentis]KAI0572684.1 glutathione s-transferase [Pyrenophora tritici-repentis]KAI0578709.1 glutathione s-transferase [Pyrenophora tritici-repentis]